LKIEWLQNYFKNSQENSQENSQIMFQICVFNQKVQRNETLKFFINATTKNIKIQNIFDIIEISKSMEPNQCTY